MKPTRLRLWPLACLALFSACNRTPAPTDGNPRPGPSGVAQLGDAIDLSLQDLLAKPRADLAALAQELLAKVETQEKGRLEGRVNYNLLPSARLPLVVPVWREAKYSAQAGISLPPYHQDDARDAELALHLARFGDVEAAKRLVDPADAATLKQINAYSCERNFPVEWTRVVALLLHEAQTRLATGELDGATEILALHKQVREILGPKAAQGALGVALLPRGRAVLAQAAEMWRSQKRVALADQTDTALAEWGEMPSTPLLPAGLTRARAARLLGCPDDGKILSSASCARALDLLGLPFPLEGAQTVLANLDESGVVQEVYLLYRSGLRERYGDPSRLAHFLEDGRHPGEDAPKAPGMLHRTYQVAQGACDVYLMSPGVGAGAVVRCAAPGARPRRVPLNRDFGAVHLDRSFEQNRLQLAPELQGDSLTASSGRALARVVNPLNLLKPTQAVLQRTPGLDLTAALALRYGTDDNGLPALALFVLPLWNQFGPPRLGGLEDGRGIHLTLTWEDVQTRYVLQLPYDSVQPSEFRAEDTQPAAAQADRAKRAAAFDRAERQARLDAGKPLTRNPRHLEQIELGMTKTQALRALPAGKAVVKREIPGGALVTYTENPDRKTTLVVRQLVVCWGKAERVAEVRSRYFEGPGAKPGGGWAAELLNTFKARSGAPEAAPSPWAALWEGMPPRKTNPVCFRWEDDLTVMTYLRDIDAVELSLRDRAAGDEAGEVPPLSYLPRGPENCLLGTEKSTLIAAWDLQTPETTEDGAVVLRPRNTSNYDYLLVWFAQDRVARVVARHPRKGGTSPQQLEQALSAAWSRDVRLLGWPRRQDATALRTVQGMAWHDDRTRVRLFWEESDANPPRIFTEWKELP